MLDAKLQGANLFNANLKGARLCGANLRKSDLCLANLQETDLCWAKLHEAKLCGANLQGTIISILTVTSSLKELSKADFRGVQSSLETRDKIISKIDDITDVTPYLHFPTLGCHVEQPFECIF